MKSVKRTAIHADSSEDMAVQLRARLEVEKATGDELPLVQVGGGGDVDEMKLKCLIACLIVVIAVLLTIIVLK